jgi:hypothetical protein
VYKGLTVLVYEALIFSYIRTYATSVWGLKLQVYEAALKLLVYAQEAVARILEEVQADRYLVY